MGGRRGKTGEEGKRGGWGKEGVKQGKQDSKRIKKTKHVHKNIKSKQGEGEKERRVRRGGEERGRESYRGSGSWSAGRRRWWVPR